jgi:hypothetical protein
MRLYGAKAIMRHLGYSERNALQWRIVQRRYAAAIKRDAASGRAFAETEDIDAILTAKDPADVVRMLRKRSARFQGERIAYV